MFWTVLVVRAHVPKMNLDELFEQKDEVAKAVLEELEKVNLCPYGDWEKKNPRSILNSE